MEDMEIYPCISIKKEYSNLNCKWDINDNDKHISQIYCGNSLSNKIFTKEKNDKDFFMEKNEDLNCKCLICTKQFQRKHKQGQIWLNFYCS